MDTLVNVVIGVEALIALYLIVLNYRELRFLEEKVRPLLHPDEELPLFDALRGRAKYVTAVGVYLVVLTAIGALGVSVTEIFPPIRAINGALFLGLIAGPRVMGRALRRRVDGAAADGPGDPSPA